MGFKLYMEMDSQGQGAAIPDLEFAACCGVSDRSVREFKTWLVNNGFVKIIVKGARGRVSVFAASIPNDAIPAMIAGIQIGGGLKEPAHTTGNHDEYRHRLPEEPIELPETVAGISSLPANGAGIVPAASRARGLNNNINITNTSKVEEEDRGSGGKEILDDESFKLTPRDALAAFELYNAMALRVGLPQARTLTPQRRKSLIARMREHGGLDAWKIALANVEKSAFLQGKNDRGWRADFDFLLQASRFTKVVEGTYGNGAHAGDDKSAEDDGGAEAAKQAWQRQVIEDALREKSK